MLSHSHCRALRGVGRQHAASVTVSAAHKALELRICTQGKVCKRQGSQQLLKFAADLGLEEIQIQGCGCLGNCGNGPNMVLLPYEVLLSHVATPADVLGVLRQACGVEVPPRVLQAVELRLAGNTLAGAGDLQGALARYLSALALAPGRGEHMLHSNAAAACLQLGRHEEALEHAQAAVALAPAGFTNAAVRLVDSLYALGRFEEAAAACDQAVRDQPGFTALPEYQVIRRALAAQQQNT